MRISDWSSDVCSSDLHSARLTRRRARFFYQPLKSNFPCEFTKYGISNMLQKLNERIQGVIAWVVIILIAVTFTLFGVDYYMQSHQTSDVEVDVNGQPIGKQAFDINYRRVRQQRDPSQITAASELALKKQVLTDMITNVVS